MWLSGCSGDYPLDATACDEYCHTTQGLQCGFYEPAGCVSQCERELKGEAACWYALEATLGCFKTTGALMKRCRAYIDYPLHIADAGLCEAQVTELEVCSSTLRVANDQM
jgi:hypothetical protein